MTRGRFITLEGIEGVGKTTHGPFVTEHLKALGRDCVLTREPGGTALGEALRAVLLDPKLPGMAPLTELLLMFAARAEHIARVIEPALAAGQWVVCDRFTDATFAYQGGGRGLDAQAIATLEQFVQGALRPDVTVLFDAPVELALERTRHRGAADRFEQERHDFFRRVRDCYLARAAAEPARFRTVDAAMPLEQVQATLAALVGELAA
ncbi:MAG: dTMP kinase [Gammaproteobacteria bacterium]|nr:dTMP kinase [Gammaproteobacteria bacterium]